MTSQPDLAGFEFETVPAAGLTEAQRARVLGLFDACYRQADHAFLERSLERLRYVSLAVHQGRLVGFGLGDGRGMDLPRLPQQAVAFGGLCCIAPQFRRRGLFGELQRRSILAARPPASERLLMCGRMAHPVGLRMISSGSGVVPRPNVRPTPWQREVGRVIAEAYGVQSFDPQTFVCRGTGRPIGYPIVEIEVEPQDWEVFREVDRDCGDSLLGIAWSPDAPPGWQDPQTPPIAPDHSTV